MIRDKGSLRFALLTPAFQLVLFGLIDMNVRHVPTVVFDQSRTAQSRELINDFVNTSYFDVVATAPSHEALREYIVAGRAAVGVEIPPDYARRRLNDQPADFLILIDGSDSTISSQALAAAKEMAKAILANGPIACRLVLEAIRRGLEMPLVEGLVFESTLFGLCASTADMKEGMGAFLEKRPARFTGR